MGTDNRASSHVAGQRGELGETGGWKNNWISPSALPGEGADVVWTIQKGVNKPNNTVRCQMRLIADSEESCIHRSQRGQTQADRCGLSFRRYCIFNGEIAALSRPAENIGRAAAFCALSRRIGEDSPLYPIMSAPVKWLRRDIGYLRRRC